MKRLAAGILFGFAFFAHAEHRGLPVLSVLPQSQHRGGAQTFDATQDPRGVLYFGNLSGVITYDGAWWNSIKLPNDSAVFAIASDAAGVVAAGGVSELGYLVSKPDGTLAYQSLLEQLPQHARDVGEVRGICTTGRGFVYAAERFAIEWNGGAPRVIAQHHSEAPPMRCSTIDGAIHLFGGDEGLWRIAEGRLVPAGFGGMRLDAAIHAGGRTIAAVRDAGLYTLDDGLAVPFAPEASAWLTGKRVTDATTLRDGRIAITTREDGLLVLRADGAIEEILGPAAGLPDDVLLCALADREGALWLAYHGPLVRVDLASPVTVLDARKGLRGSARAMREYDGKLWIATMRGLYVLEHAPEGARRIAGIDVPAWSLLEVDGELFIGTTEGIFRIRGESAPLRMTRMDETSVYAMRRSISDPSRIWLATRSGLSTLRRDANGWRFEGNVTGTPRYVRSMREVNGELWMGTVFDGILRLGRDGTISRYGSGETDVTTIGGQLVFVRNPGEVLHIGRDGKLAPDPRFAHVKGPPLFFRVDEDASGNVWFNTDPPRMLAREGNGYARELRPLSGIGLDVQVMQFVDGAMWFAATEGLYRYAPRAAQAAIAQPAPLIRRVVASTGDTVFSDGISTTNSATALRYAFRRLRIEFAPASYQPGVEYQYRLDPIDSAWSEWSSNPFIDYTRLDDGRYTFRLRTRGATGATSNEAQWSFTVRPPWYRTPWMLLLGLLAALALVALIVTLRTRALARQAKRLQELVDERTRELEQANQHLERLSLLDELTGIPNRRYFDRALAQTWEAATHSMRPVSLILLDLDHFKMLNDERGHPAGDASLMQVARLLAQRIRRSGEFTTRGGDVVARIGGEEFAVLMSNTDAESAARIAESLRASVQEMVIAWESANLRVTVSCGVATTTHATGSPDALVRRADRALYDAKAAGRNCVREAAA